MKKGTTHSLYHPQFVPPVCVNTHGEKGCNISLDICKEHQNHFLKVMWHALGPNLNEANASRTAGTVDQVESTMHCVHR